MVLEKGSLKKTFNIIRFKKKLKYNVQKSKMIYSYER